MKKYKNMHIWMISRGVAEYAWADLSWCGMMGKGKVSKDRTAKCSQKQTGSQVNDTFMQNETTTKKIKQENQEDLLGQSASDIGLFFVFFFVFLVFVCNFACPKGRMQRVESCHVFAVLHAPRQRCRELSLVICLFSCQSMHMSKQRMCKEECKKRTLVIPCSEKQWVSILSHGLMNWMRTGGTPILGTSIQIFNGSMKYLCINKKINKYIYIYA